MRNQKFFCVVIFVVLLSLMPSLPVNQTVKALDENPLKIEKIVGLSTIPGTFRIPTGVAIAKDGTIFIADSSESQIEVFDANLKYLKNFGSIGSGEGQFQEICQIRIGQNDTVWVLDDENCCIQAFTKEGKFLKKWGEKGDKPHQLYSPIDFIFLNKNEILVTDSPYYREEERSNTLKVFSLEGKFLRNFFADTKYTSNDFVYRNLTIDQKGYVYVLVADYNKYEDVFLKFSPKGEFVCNFITIPYKDRYSNYINQICADEKYFYLTNDNALQKYEIMEDPLLPLKFLETMIEEFEDEKDASSIISPSALTCIYQKIYLSDKLLNRLTVYNTKKENLGTIQSPVVEFGQDFKNNPIPKGILSKPNGIEVGLDSHVFVASDWHNIVKEFNQEGEEVRSFGEPPAGKKDKPGENGFPQDIVFDQKGYCYVTYNAPSSIRVFKNDFSLHMTISFSDGYPGSLAINAAGFLVVALSDYPIDNLLIYDISDIENKKMTRKKSIVTPDRGLGIGDLTIDEEENIIYANKYDENLNWINLNGEIIREVEMKSYIDGILRDGAGNIYVTLPELKQIVKLSAIGETIWESNQDWIRLSQITMDSNGKLYVTESYHNLVLVISDKTAVPPVPLEPKPIETEAQFSFQLEKESILEEDTVTLRVIGKNLDKCSQLDFGIQYPPELLMFLSVKIGPLFEETNFRIMDQSVESGILSATIKSRKGEIITDSGPLLEITFTATKNGTGTFEFARITLKNPLGQEVLYKDKTPLPFTILALDKTPPVLTLQPIPQLVYHSSLLIQGETEPEAIVTINQKPVEVKPDGKFESTVDLQKGKNKITITATDKAGNKTELTLETTLQDKIIIKLYVGSKVIIVNGTPGALDSEPYIDKSSGRTMVPLRAIGEAIGAIITFDPSTQQIDIKKDVTIIQLWIGKPKAMVNGVSVDIDPDKPVSPVIVKGRTFLPLRFIAEAFEFKVEWDAPTQRITLTYPKE